MPSTPVNAQSRVLKPSICEAQKNPKFFPFEMGSRDLSLTAQESDWLRSQWKHFDVRPYHASSSLIADKTFMVPYNGEKHKPTIQEVHGKKRFDFYAYTFRIPGREEKTSFGIMWDVETGMVRTYSIYRSLGYEKSAPAETFKATPGLPDLAVNITGGKIDIQGFWIPYDAALELCARFAWDLRAVLYPLFGPAILRRAVPDSHPRFRDWTLPPALIQSCRAALPVVAVAVAAQTPRRPRAAIATAEDSEAESPPAAAPVLRRSGRGRRARSPAPPTPLLLEEQLRVDSAQEASSECVSPAAQRLREMSEYEQKEHEVAVAMLLMAQKERLGSRVETPHLQKW